MVLPEKPAEVISRRSFKLPIEKRQFFYFRLLFLTQVFCSKYITFVTLRITKSSSRTGMQDPAKHLRWIFFAETVPLHMFNWVLNTPLKSQQSKYTTEKYLRLCRTSTVKRFAIICTSSQPLTIVATMHNHACFVES